MAADWRASSVALTGLVGARLAGIIWSAARNTHGDYYASLPGSYVRNVNPVLWNSADLQGAMGFHLDTYYHGPTQYLTLYPVAFLDSYAQIAWVLLVVYALALGAAFWSLYRALALLAPTARLAVPLTASTFLFFPLLQAYLQREFEVVVFLGLTAALWLLLRDRRGVAAAVLAYVAWFKYVPLLFGAYLVSRGWFRAVAVFVATSIGILGITDAVFGLAGFVNNNVPGHAAQVLALWNFGFWTDAAGELHGTGFCQGWFESETTLANIRHGLCTLSAGAPWFPANLVYLVLCAIIAVVYLVANRRLAGSDHVNDASEAWRRALEFSIVTVVCACFFFAHYYYLIVLVIPLNVLLTRYLSGHNRVRLWVWGLSYFLISAFVVPTGLLSRAFGVDVWAAFIRGGWFMYGELLLMVLLLREYWELSRAVSSTLRPSTARAGVD